jgi:putative FmdB family regulatory protein
MPTYDYECASCGHTFDEFQAMSDEPLRKCPECGKNSLRRLIGGGLGVIFKGSGFYATDSRSASKSSTAASSSPTSSSDSSKKTETAPKTDSGGSSAKNEKVAG